MSQESEAIVVEVLGQEAVLRLTKPVAGCGHCDESGGCASGLMGRGCRTYRLPNDIGAAVGDRVSISVDDGAILRASLFSYILPAFLAILGAAVGSSHGGDAWAVAGTVAGLVAGFLLLRRFGAGRGRDFSPRILRLHRGAPQVVNPPQAR